MLMEKERQLIVEYGRKLITQGLTRGTSGNLSIFNREKNLLAISPSGMDYFEIQAEDVVILDIEGNIVDGHRKPSSEVELHRIFYERRQDINAIVHTHSIYSTVLACLNYSLPAVHYVVASAGKDVRCAQYATFGTRQLAENTYKAMEGRKAVLLANHGLLTGGKDLKEAFGIAESVEYCAEIYYRAKSIGQPVIIGDGEMEIILEKFKTYGQQDNEDK
ncbi:MAG: L-fuculose-phosphate aldolase [Tissierellia bacterium]|nr:L-fuculose-phosphate aldolase [Tissierellia bacterium]